MTTSRLSDLHARLDRAATDIAHLRARLDTAHGELRRAQPGVRSVPTDAAHNGHGGDPVAGAAHAREHDPAVRALDELVDWIAGIEQRALRARVVVDMWAARPTGNGAGAGDAGCQWMRHHGGPWEEARYHVTITGRAQPDGAQPATVGKLDTGRVLWVGQRTYRHVRDHGELPSRDDIVRWSQGRQARRRTTPPLLATTTA